jgi:hypothetical protein
LQNRIDHLMPGREFRADQSRCAPAYAVIRAGAHDQRQLAVVIASAEPVEVIQPVISIPPECRSGQVSIRDLKEKIWLVPLSAAAAQASGREDHFTAALHASREPHSQ